MSRTFLVGGNWKLNGDKQLITKMADQLSQTTVGNLEIVVAPPFHLLSLAKEKFTNVHISAQNCSEHLSGAYTGEISTEMLKDIQVGWVILGHSERREYYGEDDQTVGRKVGHAVKQGLNVIACIGEKLQERESGQTLQVLVRQLDAIAQHVSDWSKIVIAYEPVWAIGTGKVATPQQAQETHKDIRQWLKEKVSPAVAESTRILYGGSVNAKNCQELQQEPDIDGFLVGGASLKPADFATICQCKLSGKL
ncbi:Triosephosphate isomerase [Gorgonomyces haynaldii]|nr:Triosephosphate isomerase [Gorgonomyces haynaldii]